MCAKLTRTMISNWYFVPIGKIKIKKKVEKYFWMVYNRVWTIADQGSSMLRNIVSFFNKIYVR